MDAAPSLELLTRPAQAAALLHHPLRLRILHALAEPDSAAGIARRLHLPRQRVNYHVRELARARLIERAGRRRCRNMVEQRYRAVAQAYVLSPELLGALSPDARRIEDTLSAAYLLALTSQAQTELARASREAAAAGKRLMTLSINTEFRFTSPEQRAEFAEAVQQALVDVIVRFTSPARTPEGKPGAGRPYRLILGCYPIPPKRDDARSTEGDTP